MAFILTVVLLQHIAYYEVVFGATNVYCPTSNFKVFNDPDVHDLGVDRLPPGSPERLAFAAKPGESHVVRLTRSSQLGISQEGANINLDCLPWLSQFPGGSIRWYSVQLDEFDNQTPYSNRSKFMYNFSSLIQYETGYSIRWPNGLWPCGLMAIWP